MRLNGEASVHPGGQPDADRLRRTQGTETALWVEGYFLWMWELPSIKEGARTHTEPTSQKKGSTSSSTTADDEMPPAMLVLRWAPSAAVLIG